MAPNLGRQWSSGKSGTIKVREVSPEGSELIRMDWRKAPGPRDGNCEIIIRTYAALEISVVLNALQRGLGGLSDTEAANRLELGGRNLLSSKQPPTKFRLLVDSINNPFMYLLVIIAVVSAAAPPHSWDTFGVLVAMVLISSALSYWQELRSTATAIQLQAELLTEVQVRRNGQETTVIDEQGLVPGDILLLSPGDPVPADCLLIEASNLSVSQSSLSGESEAQRKAPGLFNGTERKLFEHQNIVFMRTHVLSGSGVAVVLSTGDDTFIATIMKELNKQIPTNAFQRGIRNLSFMMIIFMIVISPIVLVVSAKSTGSWYEAAMFTVATAIGLVPEMLPAIVKTNLARGAFVLRKKKAIVKRLNSIQNLGAMTVLCSDKTGTLTKDETALCQYVDASGNQNRILYDLAYINASNQSGKKNAIDKAILAHSHNPTGERVVAVSAKLGEIPFTSESRRSSSITPSKDGKPFLICKGAFEEVLALCARVRLGSGIEYLDPEARGDLCTKVSAFNNDGYRVILVATRCLLDDELHATSNFGGLDRDLVAEGLLTFLDPSKDDAKSSIARLRELGVDTRVLTGDNLDVALHVCRALEIVVEVDEEKVQAITGHDLAQLNHTEFRHVVSHCKIFAKLTPNQKGQIVKCLQEQGEVVGMLGDGINDCVALRDADIGMSVDTGTNAAKSCADVVLTEKALSIIIDCVITGRVTQGNTIKYIKMVTAANFGNVFSVLIGSAWLPCNPMTALQILVQNLLYDSSQLTIPWDTMDEEYVAVPQGWRIGDLLRFVVIFGPTSSIIDVCTFMINWFYYSIRSVKNSHDVAVFQSHWFIVGLVTQTLIVHLLRTAKWPFVQSTAAKPVVYSTVAVTVIGLVLPYVPGLSKALGLVRPYSSFLGFLAAGLVLYCVMVQVLKMLYIELFKRWL